MNKSLRAILANNQARKFSSQRQNFLYRHAAINGFWIGGGADYMVTDVVSVGLNLRLSSADGDYQGDTVANGGTHFGVSVGYHIK
ncbi:MAG: hypothetical protein HY273_06995 [Gammaproteobacteria bacterium]|nr:hypothetical protein [Gammaproteobacteria bacterium]